MRISAWISFLLLGMIAQAGGCAANSEPASSTTNPIAIEEALWWLPEDTEMVAVQQLFPQKNQDATFGIAQIGLGGIRRGKFAQQVASLKIARMVSGSRKFRMTKGFGMLPFEGCTMIFLKSALTKDHALSKWLNKNAERTKEIAGSAAYIFGEKLEQDRWYFLVAQPHPQILLCATNDKFLESVLRRRVRSEKEREKTIRALPTSLALWKHVDVNAAEWALRHYRQDQISLSLDPTSPLSGDQRMANIPDKSAIGLTYSLDQKRSRATIRYLTAPLEAAHMTKAHRNFWAGLISGMGGPSKEARKWRPVINERPNGLVEMQFIFSKPFQTDTQGMFSFGLMGLIGHAIIV